MKTPHLSFPPLKSVPSLELNRPLEKIYDPFKFHKIKKNYSAKLGASISDLQKKIKLLW
jgi:hypothetical protein